MKQLFKLLQLGLQTVDVNTINTSEFALLSMEEWTAIKEMAAHQGVMAIVLDGINQLPHSDYNLPSELKLEWIGEAFQIEQKNRRQMAVTGDLVAKWKAKGCKVMIMKGQASGTMYPKPEHRTPGDIDCYLFENYAEGNDIARMAGANVDESWYKHSVINYKNEIFENHQYFVHTRDGKRGKRLEKELEGALSVQDSNFVFQGGVMYPPVQWNAMFLTCHSCGHFVSEGLRLKQILDWAMFLKTHQNDVDWDGFYAFCERNHLRRFVDAITSICVDYLGVKVAQNSQITFESLYAEKILRNTLHDDDYVFASGSSSWFNRWHLLRNLFRYRWKYEEIYQMSIYRQLWYYASGYLFKTE